jgi:hypothetical protein
LIRPATSAFLPGTPLRASTKWILHLDFPTRGPTVLYLDDRKRFLGLKFPGDPKHGAGTAIRNLYSGCSNPLPPDGRSKRMLKRWRDGLRMAGQAFSE